MIDRKYKIIAYNPCSGGIHTEEDAVLFLAKDLAILPTLKEYLSECNNLGCENSHLQSVRLLMERIEAYQKKHEPEIADIKTACEYERCIEGNV